MGSQVIRRQMAESGRVLQRCAASCELALKANMSRFRLSGEQGLVRALLPAIATLRTAADMLHDEHTRQLALHLAHEACSQAANECRRYGFDEPLLRCAATCDQALAEIELLLTSLVHD